MPIGGLLGTSRKAQKRQFPKRAEHIRHLT